ncbi:MAG: hypothetical protein KBB88_01370 [Candidatus Pacebacteria bacterium]|nr:hypothetical protein [Candidatus Paceibacterota bacterium]
MRKIIRHIRKKPRDVRQQMLFVVTFFTFAVLVGLWIIISDARSREQEVLKGSKRAESPFSILGDSIRQVVDSIKNK